MKFRQRLIRIFYPLIAMVTKKKGLNMRVHVNESGKKPNVSFYSLSTTASNGDEINFDNFRNRKVLLVNTASECGYTPQFDDLQKLQDQYAGRLQVIGFPSNDFGAQEPGSDAEIASFCRVNYGVKFPLAQKSHVKEKPRNEVYMWLTDAAKNGWNKQQPEWNFCKYLIDERGNLAAYFASSIQPFDSELLDSLK